MKIGVLGGGQLARMLAIAGYPLGLEFIALDPEKSCCARQLMPIVQGEYTDFNALDALAKQVDLITYENENIPAASIKHLQQSKTVHPSLAAILASQDRLLEKELFTQLGMKVALFHSVESKQDLIEASKKLGFPFILKTRRFGYDGKGQWKFTKSDDLAAFTVEKNQFGYLAESFVHFDREVSCIGVRSTKSELAFYDLCENKHHKGILIQTQPKRNYPLASTARDYMKKTLEHLDYAGTLVIEFFVVGDELYVNEMAPRVHNSGHWTIEGAVTSQFENHLRAICGFPLGKTNLIAETLMLNVIGAWGDRELLLKTPNLHIHDYQKTPRPGRKIGHLTIMPHETIDEGSLIDLIKSNSY